MHKADIHYKNQHFLAKFSQNECHFGYLDFSKYVLAMVFTIMHVGRVFGETIGRWIAIFNSGIGYQILSRHTDRISDIGYRISESDSTRQMIKRAVTQQC